MELRHLRSFVAVAEELHFGRAAQRMDVSQPPFTVTIKQLEKEVGAELLYRTKRTVRLTDAGQVFLERTRQILDLLDQAMKAAQRVKRGETGRLVVGMVGTAAIGPFPHIVRAYRQRFPSVALELLELTADEQRQALREERIDVGFMYSPGSEPGVESATLKQDPFLAVLPKQHRLARRSAIPLGTLAAEPFVCCSEKIGVGVYEQIVGFCRQAGFMPKVVHEATHLLSALALVAAGTGVCLAPSSVRNISCRDVAFRPLREPVPMAELGIIWRAGDPTTVLREFLKTARAVTANGSQ